ncbi:MAG: Gfo/Idh/MocA family oxidoreductase [Phycisphaerae bacterium]|nr:Gfo/Idh/MocA family oxidoreductase [Phycisphaerae bacterium]
MERGMKRREFLGAAAGAAAGMILPETVMSVGIGERNIRLGYVGVGKRGTQLVECMFRHKGIVVPAVCDMDAKAADRASGLVEKAGGKRPETYTKGPKDYVRMFERDDLDAIVVAVPMPIQGPISGAAMRAGKHVLSEVAPAITLEQCWDLVRAVEESGKTYMLAENVCYFRDMMMLQNMLAQGVFGRLTYAECGYIHDMRHLGFNADGSPTAVAMMFITMIGNLYPTHAIGPVAQFMGIGRTDRFVSLTAATSVSEAVQHYAARRFGKDHPSAKIKPRCGDMTNAFIKTGKGLLIELRFDMASTRPHPNPVQCLLQGTKAAYQADGRRIYIEGRSKGYDWESLDVYQKEYEHPLWRQFAEQAKGTGYDGADYFMTRAFVETLRTGAASPINVYDAALWASIIPLSAASIQAGGKPQAFPDFAAGATAKKPS